MLYKFNQIIKSFIIPNSFTGAALMIFTCACFSGMSALIRELAATISPFEIAFFRNIVSLILVAPFFLCNGFKRFQPTNLRPLIWRAIFGILAMWAWYSSLALIPLAEAVALNFTVALWMIPVAIIMLNERIGIRRWIATLIGFGGVLIVLQPGAETMSFGGFLAILSALLFAVSMALVRSLSKTESATSIVFWMNLFLTPLSLGPAIWFWITPNPIELILLIAVGALATIAHYSMARALSMAEASALTPLDFIRLPFAALIGYFMFSEVPAETTWIGGTVIILSAIYIAHRESKNKVKSKG